jgi:predicted regulator of amino acid metabolism with ACT domain
MSRSFNYERAAMVLCDAVMLGDRKAAQKWGVSLRSICNWRESLENDEKLRNLMQEYRQAQTEKWLEDIPTAMSAMIEFFTRAAQESNPQAATAADIVAAFEAIADVESTQKIIAARLKDAGQF